jgi:hypothetical protein
VTINRLTLTERDHARTERIILHGRQIETETAIGYISVSVHGQVYFRPKSGTVPMLPAEAQKVIIELQHYTNFAHHQARTREGVANDCESVFNERRSRLWRRRGGKKVLKNHYVFGAYHYSSSVQCAKCKRPVTPRKRSPRVSVHERTEKV